MSATTSGDGGSLDLPDGRRLGYVDSGDPDGQPVVLLADLGHSRLGRHPDATRTAAAGARLVTLDRPGYGLSTRRPGRHLVDTGGDVRRLADALGLARFAVLGWAGGAPHALATAFSLGSRVPVVGLVAPLPPSGILAEGSAEARRRGPLNALIVRRGLRRQAHALQGDPAQVFERLLAGMSLADRTAAMDTPGFGPAYVADVQAAFAQGISGVLDDGAAVDGDWGFGLDQVRQPVHIWHGGLDEVVPPAAAQALAARLPDAHLTLIPDAAHLVLLSAWEDILGTLVGALAALPPVPPREHRVVTYQPAYTTRLTPRTPRAPRPTPPPADVREEDAGLDLLGRDEPLPPG